MTDDLAIATPRIRAAVPAPSGPVPASVFGVVAMITLAVAALCLIFPPPDAVAAAAALVVIAVLGLPHGAVDHAVASALADTASATQPPREERPADRLQLRFHTGYLAAIVGYGVVWLVAPFVALVAFLLLSIHHFGQSDLAHLRLPPVDQVLLQVSRGLLVVALPLVAHLDQVAPIVEGMSGRNAESWPLLADHAAIWSVALVVQHAAVLAYAAPRLADRRVLAREVVTATVLTLVLVAAPPLIGFAVYFGLWHSLNHLFVLSDVLARPPTEGRLSLRALARIAAPRSGLALFALGALSATAVATDRLDLVVPLALVLVSVLTLPHMVVVERLWSARRA